MKTEEEEEERWGDEIRLLQQGSLTWTGEKGE